MPVDVEKIANIFGQETIRRVYEDGASQSVKEGEKALTALVKSFRLFLAPVQLLGAWQERLEKYLERVRGNVKEENQVEAPSAISGPAIEQLKYQEEGSPLTELYINLLSRAIDKERVQEAHPAFLHIIEQLSADEAMILYLINQEPIRYEYTMELYRDDRGRPRFNNSKTTLSTIPNEKLAFPDYFNMYVKHMESLNLLFWRKANEESVINSSGSQTGTSIQTLIELTHFGYLFVKACILEKGFIIIQQGK